MSAPARLPRETRQWVICEDTGQQAINGVCPTHHGDRCLIVVGWVDNSHVRRELAATQARLWEVEAELARLRAAVGLADDLLRRLSEWDMLWPGPPPVTADGPYWQGEIARVRAALAEPAGEENSE